MREVVPADGSLASEAQTFMACLATILELPLDAVPEPIGGEELAESSVARWLGGLGLGFVKVADAESFSWAGPWIARIRPAGGGECAAVVMYGTPSGVAWDPVGVTAVGGWELEDGYVVCALDIALARPALAIPPSSSGSIETIAVAATAGATPHLAYAVRALAGRGLDGDRHVTGAGTFPSGLSGSALTLIEAEVCESFRPALKAKEHRRNLTTRGIDLNALVGHEFGIGDVLCRGTRLCEPCTVLQGYTLRPVLRELVHRGGLRADILEGGMIHVGDPIAVL